MGILVMIAVVGVPAVLWWLSLDRTARRLSDEIEPEIRRELDQLKQDAPLRTWLSTEGAMDPETVRRIPSAHLQAAIDRIKDARAWAAEAAAAEAKLQAKFGAAVDLARLCESEPERLLLAALIANGKLTPSAQNRMAGLFDLEIQGWIRRYRFDFMLRGRLVVEVDGAEYHSSPEQRLRDDVRDVTMKDLGYSVARYAARDVFEDPDAVARDAVARSMLAPAVRFPGKRFDDHEQRRRR